MHVRHLVKVELGFGMFDRGEQLLVDDAFLERHERYLAVLGDVADPEAHPADLVVELDGYEDSDGEGADLHGDSGRAVEEGSDSEDESAS
jgi:hypothetical protein